MLSEQRLREDLRFVSEFATLCDVVQQAAVAQLHRADERWGAAPSLTDVLRQDFFPLVPEQARTHLLTRGGPGGRLLVVMTSDEGMVGPLHALVLRHAHALQMPETRWMLVGQRGARLVGDRPGQMRVMAMPAEEELGHRMGQLARAVLHEFVTANLRDAWLVAPRYRSATRQEVVEYPLLPLPCGVPSRTAASADLVLEPDAEAVVQGLATVWVAWQCLEACWSARRAEFAARAMHMESARHELAQHSRRLQHEFFKAMHTRVDVMVRESCIVQRHGLRRPAPSSTRGGR